MYLVVKIKIVRQLSEMYFKKLDASNVFKLFHAFERLFNLTYTGVLIFFPMHVQPSTLSKAYTLLDDSHDLIVNILLSALDCYDRWWKKNIYIIEV
jgi:hypothetical protein